jgi:hypothetical protein
MVLVLEDSAGTGAWSRIIVQELEYGAAAGVERWGLELAAGLWI